MSLSAFLAENAVPVENIKFVASKRFLGEDGNPIPWEIKTITGTEDACLSDQELSSTGAVIEAVRTTPGAIGYASLSAVEGQEGITVLTVDGVAPSEATVLDGTYTIQRPFVFVTKTDGQLSDVAQAFFDFATSTDANDLIAGAGAAMGGDFQLVHIQLELEVLSLGQYGDGDGRGMNTPLRLSLGDALHTVDAGLIFEP